MKIYLFISADIFFSRKTQTEYLKLEHWPVTNGWNKSFILNICKNGLLDSLQY